uniref:AIG1-type G domain-containing protein n=1 Tax=Biomphalaria glabrata TaxID=6526 RepID=A0A2C9LX99_BIOGL
MIFRSTLSIQEKNAESINVDGLDEEQKYLVQSLQIGNEIIAIMTVTINDTQEVLKAKLLKEIDLYFPENYGTLDQKKLTYLYPRLHNIEKLFLEVYDRRITYISFDNLDKRPANFQGMIKTIFLFRKSADSWATIYRSRKDCSTVSRELEVRDAENNVSEDVNILESRSFLTRFWNIFGYTCDSDLDNTLNTNNADSRDFFCIKGTLKLVKQSTQAPISASSRKIIEMIGKYLIINKYTLAQVEDHMKYAHNFSEQDKQEGKMTIDLMKKDIQAVSDFVARVSFHQVPVDENIDEILLCDRVKSAKQFIKNTNLVLPKGGNLDLLLMGKSKNGKSSTGNSILGQEKFICHTKTLRPNMDWVEVDGREIKVVDTYDLCDFKNINKTICQSIVYCHEGFHAILLIFRYQSNFGVTDTEIKSIEKLKFVFGNNIIKKRCICIFTHGDKFESEIKTSFKKWCLSQKGKTKRLLEECNYRCVLFHNKTNDENVKKRQRFKLVEFLDSKSFDKSLFKNDLFKLVSSDKVKMEEEIAKGIEKVKMKYEKLIESSTDDFQCQLNDLISDLQTLKNKSAGNDELLKVISTLFDMFQTSLNTLE